MSTTEELLETIGNMKSTVDGSIHKADSQEEIKFMLTDSARLDEIAEIVRQHGTEPDIVRCGECLYKIKEPGKPSECNHPRKAKRDSMSRTLHNCITDTDFCSYGQR